jgi:hypothetical protein
MFCMYKFISFAKNVQVQKLHEQEMRRQRGRAQLGVSGSHSACVCYHHFQVPKFFRLTLHRYAYVPLKQLESEAMSCP